MLYEMKPWESGSMENWILYDFCIWQMSLSIKYNVLKTIRLSANVIIALLLEVTFYNIDASLKYRQLKCKIRSCGTKPTRDR